VFLKKEKNVVKDISCKRLCIIIKSCFDASSKIIDSILIIKKIGGGGGGGCVLSIEGL